MHALATSAEWQDVSALIEATQPQVGGATLVAHCVPELWPMLFSPRARNIGMTVWETDRPPAHWLPLLDLATAIVVPCMMNRADFMSAGVRRPIHVVPHIRSHARHPFTAEALRALRAELRIPGRNFVFTTIGTWDPRNAIPALLDAYLDTFDASDPVSLIVKTSVAGWGAPPLYLRGTAADEYAAVVGAWKGRTGREPAHVVLIAADDADARFVAGVRQLTDCFVSLSHGEGWGLGAFEAAQAGTPVLVTGWGGQMDYLKDCRAGYSGERYPGALPFRIEAAPIWPPDQPSYHSSQRWACADPAAARAAMRAIAGDPGPARAAASALQEEIANFYAEPVVARTLREALFGAAS